MKLLFRDRKGELTTKQLVGLIILIVSFAIILFLIFRLNLGETTAAEICRNSVALRGQSKLVSGPLDCRTTYVCVSGGEECQTNKDEILEVDSGNKTQIMQTLAEKMSECWWMFGEGKVNYGTPSPAEKKVEYALCSIIEFNENVGVSQISYSEFYDYLRKTQKTSSQTYLQYLYSTSTTQGIDSGEHVQFSLSESIDIGQRYSILTGIDNNPTPIDDVILKVYIIPTAETDSRLVEDREFITKA